MKTASFSIAILNFFSRHGQYFHPTKDQPRTRPSSTFLYICYNFRQIFCTNVIQFFSVENMGHNQLQKCTKYHLVSLLNEKQGSTFANFLHFFYPVTLLTNSAFQQRILEIRWLRNQLPSGKMKNATGIEIACNPGNPGKRERESYI